MLEDIIKKSIFIAARSTRLFLLGVCVFLLIIYLCSGIYSISPNEVGVVQRFGRMMDQYARPGIHCSYPWPIDRINKVPIKKIHRIIFDSFSKDSFLAKTFRDVTGLGSYCITGDNNIVNLTCVLQYTIAEPADYLFVVHNNEQTLQSIFSNTIIHTVSSMPVDEILTFGKRAIENRIKMNLQKRLDALRMGLNITFVELREVCPPSVVQEHFNDVINAQMDKKKFITTAESYRNEQLLKAKATATRMLQNAAAYRHKVIAEAKGETKRFLKQLKQASKNLPAAQRQLYQQFVKEIWPNIKEKYVVQPGAADYLRLGNP